jgi:hypothetical protein
VKNLPWWETSYYARHDVDGGAPFEIQLNEAERLNAKGYAIFWSVNTFKGARKKENLVSINSWAIETDAGSKAEQWEVIRSGLVPSLIIETARGFHVYFYAKDATVENFHAIVWDRLVPFYRADDNAKDVSRILRVPGFYHCKDPQNPFLVRVVSQFSISYSEADLLHFYKVPESTKKTVEQRNELRKLFSHAGDDFWERVWAMDCEVALERLSGTKWVNHEEFTFRRTASGNLNIYVNGKGTSCWVDRNGRIGSLSGGGPTIAQWLKWYGHDYREVYRILIEVFPELDRKAG